MGWSNHGYLYRMVCKRLEKRDLAVLIGSKCALATQRANCALGCPRPSTATGQGEGWSSCALWPHLQQWVQLWVVQCKGIKLLESIQRRATEMVKCLGGQGV